MPVCRFIDSSVDGSLMEAYGSSTHTTMRIISQIFSLLAFLVISGAIYLVLIQGENRYDIFDLLRGRTLTAVIGANPVLAQAAENGNAARKGMFLPGARRKALGS